MDIEEVLKRIENELPPDEEDEDLLRAYGADKNEVFLVRGDDTVRGKKIAQYLQIVHVHPELPESWFKLGQMMASNEVLRLRNGEVLDRKQLWARGIKNDPTNAKAYFKLARELKNATDTVDIPDGRVLSKVDLCLEAIRHRVDFAKCFLYLSHLLETKHATVTIYDGSIMDRHGLRMEAIRCDKTLYLAYNALAYDMVIDDVVDIGSKRLMQRDLYLLAIQHGPADPRAYVNLGALLENRETIKLLNGQSMTNQQLYIEALSLNMNNPVAWYNLSLTISKKDGTVTLKDGSIKNKRELLLEAIRLNPKYNKAFNALAYDLKKSERIDVYDRDDDDNYQTRLLAAQRDGDEELPQRRKKTMTKKELYSLGGTEFMLPVGMMDEREDELQRIETPPAELKKRKKRLERLKARQNRPRKPKKGTKERLIRFFEVYDPAKLEEVDRVLALIAGREESRFKLLVEIYGPEPPDPAKLKNILDDDDDEDDGKKKTDAHGNDGDGDLLDELDDLLPPLDDGGLASRLNASDSSRGLDFAVDVADDELAPPPPMQDDSDDDEDEDDDFFSEPPPPVRSVVDAKKGGAKNDFW